MKAMSDMVQEWKPTHRHIKRGGEYMLIGAAILQTDIPLADQRYVILYKGSMGRTYARPMEEFNDGRFERIAVETDSQ